MKRNFLKIAAVLSLVMLVGGCGKKSDGGGGDDPAPKKAAKAKGGSGDDSSKSAGEDSPKPESNAASGVSGPCGAITLDPAHEAMFSIDKVTKDHDECNVVIEAKTAIKLLVFDWKYLDKEGVKVGSDSETLKGLAAGDKAKLTISPDEGASRIVSTPRGKAASNEGDDDAPAAASADVVSLRAKITRKAWASDKGGQNDACLGDSLPPYRYHFGGGSYADIAKVAKADGCKHYGPPDDNRADWCCPK